MLWHTEPTSFDGSTMYVSGEWRIRHMSKGFGISHCWLYEGGTLVGEVVSERALERVQEWAKEGRAKPDAAPRSYANRYRGADMRRGEDEFTGAGALLACQRAAEDSTKGEAA
jgi:hypothetical protein